jgi:uncharacterized protein (TIGR03437 family)
MKGVGVVVVAAISLGGLAKGGSPSQPDQFGAQTPLNRYRAKLVLIRNIDFEAGLSDIAVLGGSASLTVQAGEVLGGTQSLKLSGPRTFIQIKPEVLGLEPLKTYVIEYDYRVLRRTDPDTVLRVAVVPPGKPFIDLGRGPLKYGSGTGSTATGIRVGDAAGTTFGLYTVDADVVIDNIRVYRHDTEMAPAQVPLWKTGFPRLGIYNLTTPEESALRSRLPLEEIEWRLSRYDLLTGSDIDHTLGAAAWVSRLHRLNPDLRIFPYHESFVAHIASSQILDGAADLNAMFNARLPDPFYMLRPDGQRLVEPDYPANLQLDLTRYCPRVGDKKFVDYTADYIANSVLPSGLWDGIHFDQPEWYPNPLLSKKDTTNPLPPIDLERNGQAASAALLHVSWLEGFYSYFREITRRFGFGQLMFGNAGYIASNTNVLPVLNGWMREIVSPYTIDANGDWVTADAAGWYRLATNYLIADRFTRAPSNVMEQFTGRGLGEALGSYTANGLPDRSAKLDARDFRRMRLGLTTTLLGNGFFSYALVDNTTAPPWFDEYAVDRNGTATSDLSGKHYLGQPLGPAVELDYPARFIFDIDFESPQLSPYFQPSASRRISFDPNEVIQGKFSMVISRDDKDPRGLIFSTNPAILKLERGKTYQLFMDYKILDYQPRTFLGILGIGISSAAQGVTEMRGASLYQPDTFGTGQTGTLRTSVKVTGDDFVATGALTDFGTAAVDNIRLVEGTGGVWRRDFERGIVLVNPTPEAISVSPAQIAGPLHRTGIRRILGTQASQVNNGQAVTSGITLGSADGIILLADSIPAAPPSTPDGVVVTMPGDEGRLGWKASTGTVAGYLVRYGEDIATPTREAASGTAYLSLQDLAPGTTYYLRVAAFDFLGQLSPFSPPVALTTAGNQPTRPEFTAGSDTFALVPGAIGSLTGFNLAGSAMEAPGAPYPNVLGETSVQVNGVPVPLIFVSPNRVEFQMPWNVAGSSAIVTVTTSGVSSQEHVLPVAAAVPQLATVDANGIADAWHTGLDQRVDLNRPAPVGETIVVRARGLGLTEPPAADGELPGPNRARPVTVPLQATFDGRDIPVQGAVLAADQLGVYYVFITVPPDLPSGLRPLRITANGLASNDVIVPVLGDSL